MIIIKEKFNRFKKIFTFFAILFLGSALFFLNHIQAENGLPLEEVELQCTDYDHGQNYYEKNKAELRELNVAEPSVITEYDVCNEDGTLKEWYCEENEEGVSMNGKIFECPNGCQNGACLTINKTNSNDYALLNNLIGKLLLQVEDRGRIWYIDFAGNKHEVTFNNALIYLKL